MLWEVVDNGIDEAMAGHADHIVVRLLPDGLVEVSDNGRGIPVEKHPVTKVSTLETVMTKLHAGGKFGEGGYKVSGGLHGVGVSVVNALSEYTKALVKRDGKTYEQEYKHGKPVRAMKMTGKYTKPKKHNPLYPDKDYSSGTTMTFKADQGIFTVLDFNWSKIMTRLRQQAYLTKGIKISAIDLRDKKNPLKYGFYFEGGIASYIKQLNRQDKAKHDNIFYVEKTIDEILVEISLRYTEEYNETVLTFTNNIHNPEGGMHLAGFRSALTRTLNTYARKNNILKEKDENLSGEDVREGLTAIISIKLADPQFEGQTKSKLGNAEVKPAVENVLSEYLTIFLEEHPRDAEAIIGQALLAAQARKASKAAREAVIRKGVLDGMTLPGKLADCSSREADLCELYIVEGDSAGGCFDGNTKIALTDGRNLSFKNLIKEHKQGKQNYCYTIKDDGTIGIELIRHPRKTKKNATVIKIILDNNEEIICTPDHKFLLRNGKYVEAKNLTPEMSLMPLYKQLSKIQGRITIAGYEMVYNSQNNKWIFTHLLADEYNLEHDKYTPSAGNCRHHIDFDKLNNNPDNLLRMSKEEHMQLHSKILKKTLHREDVKQKSREARQTPEYRKKIREFMSTPEMKKMLSQRAQQQWQNENYKQYMINKSKEFYNSNAEYREASLKRLSAAQKEFWADEKNRQAQAERTKIYFEKNPQAKECLRKMANKQWCDPELKKWRSETTKTQWTDEFREKRKKSNERKKTKNPNLLKQQTFASKFFQNNEQAMFDYVQYYNHKIKRIEKMEQKIDVYDLEVAETHNFALASGVFVHNSAKQGRDRNFQAILPLRGKILNVEKARIDKMLANNEIKSLIIALGTNFGEQFNLENLRYNRVIIMTDADVDGAHIKTLLLTLFFRYFPELIRQGHVYIAQPPLFQIKKGKNIKYVYSDDELKTGLKEFEKIKAEIPRQARDDMPEDSAPEEFEPEIEGVPKLKGVNIQRYKGLGEMNPGQLWETTMDPETRSLKKITVEDAEKADEIFDILMGGDVTLRKKFIQTHAKKVKNLDI